jgi:hypothetical protein
MQDFVIHPHSEIKDEAIGFVDGRIFHVAPLSSFCSVVYRGMAPKSRDEDY